MPEHSEPTTTKPKTHNTPTSHEAGKSGGNMGAGKSGMEGLGTETPSDDSRMGSRAAEDRDHGNRRAHDKTDSPRGGGSNPTHGRQGVEPDAEGGRRAKHNEDEDKYQGRGGGKRGKEA